MKWIVNLFVRFVRFVGNEIKEMILRNQYEISLYRKMRWYQKFIFWLITIELSFVCIITMALLKTAWWAVFVALVGIVAIVRFKLWINNRFLKRMCSGNLFIFGAKGDGKDMIIELSVVKRYARWWNARRKRYISNIDYGHGGSVIAPKDVFDLSPNTYKNLIEDNIVIIPKKDEYEGRQYILSDAAIYFPSQEDVALNRLYPSMPLFYAISRHLYDMNILVNTQVNGRLWVKLREQVQDGYVEALGCYGWGWLMSSIPLIGKYVFLHLRYYAKLQSAELGLLPFRKVAILNRVLDESIYMTTAGATKEQYEATNGRIEDMICIIRKCDVKYDTRIFHQKFFGYKAL